MRIGMIRNALQMEMNFLNLLLSIEIRRVNPVDEKGRKMNMKYRTDGAGKVYSSCSEIRSSIAYR